MKGIEMMLIDGEDVTIQACRFCQPALLMQGEGGAEFRIKGMTHGFRADPAFISASAILSCCTSSVPGPGCRPEGEGARPGARRVVKAHHDSDFHIQIRCRPLWRP